MQNQTSILKVTSVSPIKENGTGNGQNQQITVQEFKVLPIGQGVAIPTANVATRTLFKGVKNKTGDVIKSKDQIFFGTLEEGSQVMGKVVTVPTTQYDINGNAAHQFTTFIFEGESTYKIINNLLKSKGAVAKDDEGNLTAELPEIQNTTVEA